MGDISNENNIDDIVKSVEAEYIKLFPTGKKTEADVIKPEPEEKAEEEAKPELEVKPDEETKSESEEKVEEEAKSEDEVKAEEEAKSEPEEKVEEEAKSEPEEKVEEEAKSEDEVKPDEEAKSEEEKTESETKEEAKSEEEPKAVETEKREIEIIRFAPKKEESEEPKRVPRKKKHKKHMALKITFITLLWLVVGAYLVMTYLMTKYFYPNTIINGKDYTFKTIEDVNEDLAHEYDNYQIEVVYRNGNETITKADIDYYSDYKEELDKIMHDQNPFLWITCINQHNYNCVGKVGFDEAKLDDYLTNSSYFKKENMKKDKNPEIIVDGTEAKAVPGEKGTMLDTVLANSAIKEALMNAADSVDIDFKECYIPADYSVDSKEVTDAVNKMNLYLMSNITYLYGDCEVVISKEDIRSMISLTPSYICDINQASVTKYLTEFAQKHDTYGTERKFRTHTGRTINVKGKTYGWELDVEKEAENLFYDIKAGRTVRREPEFKHKGYTYNDGDDIGKSYCEVDLSNQTLYVYINGSLSLETPFVSGNVAKGNSTPGGLYCINGMTRNAVLKGRDYETPVSYWMPFNKGIGFHDANWRSSFGGSIYKTNGSHGCVNLPVSKAKALFGIIKRGMPVVCYW